MNIGLPEEEQLDLTLLEPKPQTVPFSFHPEQSLPPENVFPEVPTSDYTASPEACYPLTDVDSFVQNQSCKDTIDNLREQELIKTAKEVFIKRNRTLMHMLFPTINKHQLKIDVNAEWDSLPPSEKVLYISQVSGNFTPRRHNTMINPYLLKNTMAIRETPEKKHLNNHSSKDISCASELTGVKPQKCQKEKGTNVDESLSSKLVVDICSTETKKVKCKYTKRQEEIQTSNPGLHQTMSDTISFPKPLEAEEYIKENLHMDKDVPRIKRKYTKRKLTRKAYKKRETKNKPIGNVISEAMIICEQPLKQPIGNKPLTCEDLGLYIEIDSFYDPPKHISLLAEEGDCCWKPLAIPPTSLCNWETMPL